MQTKALEAPQAAATELLVVVLVEEALQVVVTELLLHFLGARMNRLDRLDMPVAIL